MIARVWSQLRDHPSRWLLAIVLLFMIVPGIDLGVSSWFHDPASGWRSGGFLEFVRRVIPTVIVASFVFCLVLWVAGVWYEQWFWGVTTPRISYLMVTLLAGPGLLVETVLKPNWGRARPKDITLFGGDQPFTPPVWVADACERNCSFVSGHAAVAYWVTAYAFLASPPWRTPAIAAAFLFGCAVGLVRIMQGAHFLSDVAFAAIIVVGINVLAYRMMFERKLLRRFIGES